MADVDLDVARAWLADFVERGHKAATVAARARALRVFSDWIVTDDYVRIYPLEKLKVPTIPHTIAVATLPGHPSPDLGKSGPTTMAGGGRL